MGLVTLQKSNESELECRALDDKECEEELLKEAYIQQRWQSVTSNKPQVLFLFMGHAAAIACLHSSWLHARFKKLHDHHYIQRVT